MEAANMGAYLKNRPEEEVHEALTIIAAGNDVVPPSKEFTNVQPALNVIERFGPTTYMPRCHPSPPLFCCSCCCCRPCIW